MDLLTCTWWVKESSWFKNINKVLRFIFTFHFFRENRFLLPFEKQPSQFYCSNILVRALITRTSSTWVYHTWICHTHSLKTYVRHSTRVLPEDWTGNLETYSTALWPLVYSNWWLCFKVSNLGLMFVSVRDIYNFYIESVYYQGLLSREYNSCY